MMKGIGGMGDMMGLMKKAQQMKKDMKKLKKEISKTNITKVDNNNIISVVINGDHIIQKISISENYDFTNIKNLEILIKDTINDAAKDIDKMTNDKMSVLSKQGLPTDLPF
ncbi:MAG: YbaB/EbfC family nucleoid-associated protein [Gammaproteobacteria bacterium]|jgi:nucleoid-associated protein EbfC|nr:YbaB/EbfC family nucleoid-associated protein [Gammaproteobacteria bacterium]MBT7603315.1 YbaB/EbfC family nucleoid-associated protein [Gammaproteobacteria bacterium]